MSAFVPTRNHVKADKTVSTIVERDGDRVSISANIYLNRQDFIQAAWMHLLDGDVLAFNVSDSSKLTTNTSFNWQGFANNAYLGDINTSIYSLITEINISSLDMKDKADLLTEAMAAIRVEINYACLDLLMREGKARDITLVTVMLGLSSPIDLSAYEELPIPYVMDKALVGNDMLATAYGFNPVIARYSFSHRFVVPGPHKEREFARVVSLYETTFPIAIKMGWYYNNPAPRSAKKKS